MKLKKFNIFEERIGFDDIDGIDYEDEHEFPDDELDIEEIKDIENEYEEEEDGDDDIKELTYLLRKMISASGINDFYVSNKSFDISIQFILKTSEKMKNLMKIINVVKKIKDDILIQYDSEVEMWETKNKEPLLTIDFHYESNKRGKYTDIKPSTSRKQNNVEEEEEANWDIAFDNSDLGKEMKKNTSRLSKTGNEWSKWSTKHDDTGKPSINDKGYPGHNADWDGMDDDPRNPF